MSRYHCLLFNDCFPKPTFWIIPVSQSLWKLLFIERTCLFTSSETFFSTNYEKYWRFVMAIRIYVSVKIYFRNRTLWFLKWNLQINSFFLTFLNHSSIQRSIRTYNLSLGTCRYINKDFFLLCWQKSAVRCILYCLFG